MLALLAIALLAEAPTEKPDQVQLRRGQLQLDLEWADAEDRVHGTLRPLDPIEGQPLELAVNVGTFQGTNFDGPVTVTMRCEGWSQTQTVTRTKGEHGWLVRFTPPVDGECAVDLGFTTTRYKRVHFKVPITEAPLSRVPWYVLMIVLTLSALGLGVRAIFKKEPT